MAWKQDLAKLKQQLGPEEPASPAAKPQPKPPSKPQGPVVLDDEDAVFLSAMGLKPAAPRPVRATPAPDSTPAPAAPPPAPAPAETFEAALKDLKGLKPLFQGTMAQAAPAQAPPVPAPSPAPTPAAPIPAAPVAPPPPLPLAIPMAAAIPAGPVSESPGIPPTTSVPVRFQLAAGMAIEVDGVLDLRGHSLQDAVDRLKDRLGDGLLLGWRTLQVILGPDPKLHEGLLALLASGEASMVARYAQAPVPMGGSQAWLLYFGPSPSQSQS